MLGLGGTEAHGKRLRKWPWRRAPKGLRGSKAPPPSPRMSGQLTRPHALWFPSSSNIKSGEELAGRLGREHSASRHSPDGSNPYSPLSGDFFTKAQSLCRGRVCLILSLRAKHEAAKSIPLEKLSHPPGTCRAPGVETGRACGGAPLRGPRITPSHLRAGARQVSGKSLGFGKGAL